MRFFSYCFVFIVLGFPAWGLKFSLPIDCGKGKKCPLLIQNYVDTGCTEASYKGHQGTDFRLIYFSDTVSHGGVNVLASAPGRVIGIRNDMEDLLPPLNPNYISGRDCGNGVRIDHGQGWVTQVCHLLKGSVLVRPGDRVQQGQALGKIGYSGRAEFPHVHLQIEKGGKVMSPFWGFPVGEFRCDAESVPLWEETALKEIRFNADRTFLSGGASSGRPDYSRVKNGDYKDVVLATNSPALVAWVFTMNRKAGDQDRIMILAPEGKVLVDSTSKPLERYKANYLAFTGKPRRSASWPIGEYSVVWEGLREGKVFETKTFLIRVQMRSRL
jgi:hypothetical protein